MSRLYNANLDDRTCIEERHVGNDLPLDEFLTALQEAAEGLENPTVEIDHEQYYDSCEYRIVVSGRRPLTDAEVAQEEHNRAVHRARREEYEQAELRLLARLSAEPTGRFSTSAPNDQSLPRREAEKQALFAIRYGTRSIPDIIRRKAEDGNGPDWKDHQ